MILILSHSGEENDESQFFPDGIGDRKLLRGMRFGFGSTRLTAALRKKNAYLFVNQASALAGKGKLSTQPPKCYAHN